MDRDGTLSYPSNVADAMFLYYKEKTMKTYQSALLVFTLLQDYAVCAADAQMGVLEFFWSNFLACFAMSATDYKHSTAVFQTEVDVTLQYMMCFVCMWRCE